VRGLVGRAVLAAMLVLAPGAHAEESGDALREELSAMVKQGENPNALAVIAVDGEERSRCMSATATSIAAHQSPKTPSSASIR
jgi:hypothetical protein